MKSSPFHTFPEIRTERLLLRRLTLQDVDEFIPIAWYEGKALKTKQNAIDILEKCEQNYFTQNSINWGIFFDGKLVGTCGFYRGFENDTGEVGYVLNEMYHRKGFMSEAVAAVVRFGFDELNLQKIMAYTSIENGPSVGLLKKLGFEETKVKVNDLSEFMILR